MKKILFIPLLFLTIACTQEIAEQQAFVNNGNGMAIVASIGVTTKTDISEGKSTWEAGDSITVVYDGVAYGYVTESGGETAVFTSAQGIESFDSSKSLVAYYPTTTADGTVTVEAERTVTLAGDTQANAAKAPLVGTVSSTAASAIDLVFSNIFSVIELRIDAGTLTSRAASLTVEPASDQFDGFITFTGTVDPSTLALTAAESGASMKLVFDGGADLSQSQIIKFPVGRFTSPDGLTLTLATEDGNTYSKIIYKTGVTSYTESGGTYSVKHMAKAVYAFGSAGGIRSADDLVEFADAVHAGESLAEWQNSEGTVTMLYDIDMAEVTDWTPIGEANFSWASNKLSISSGNPFTGHFDGDGHTITNFDMVCKASGTASNAWGMFGALSSGAIVENIIFDETCSLTVSATAGSDVGMVAGLAYNSTVQNITNYAPMAVSSDASSSVRLTMGLVGFAFAGDGNTTISKCNNYGAITAESAGNTNNGATAVQVAGILGFGTNLGTSTTDWVYVTECENYGNLDTKVARAAGIVGAANRYTDITLCNNYGENTNEFATSGGGRLGNITCVTQAGSRISQSANYGDLISKTSARCGGVVSLVNNANNEFDRAANYGKIVSDNTDYSGTLFSYCNLAASFTSCIAQGDLGTYDNGSITYYGVNAANYFSYIGYYTSNATNVTSDNIIWALAEAATTFSVSPASTTVDVWGASPVVAELSSVDYSWTATADDWLTLTDLSDVALTGGSASEYVQNIKIKAAANSLSTTREGTVTFTATEDPTQTASMTIVQDAPGDPFPSKWVFSASNLDIYGDMWTDSYLIPATNGASGSISAARGEKYSSTDLNYTIYGNKPTITTFGEGDYWLFTFPVDHLDAGSAIEFDITTGGGTGGPKYFIVEYYEDGEWKSVETDLRTATEDESVKYTYMSSGKISDTYQYSTVMQTFRLASAIDNDNLYIRSRVVGSMNASGTDQDVTATGRSLFPLFGFTGGYVQNYGTAEPTDTKTILCLGNSFSYYSNPVFMLKEIAYSQGHYIRMRAHLKGSQTLTDHCTLEMSLDAIGQETYDYAFIQDQSQNPAKYGQNGTASILEGCTTLTGLIKEASPSCQVILEETWAFSSSSYGGFGSYDQFDTYNKAGALAMAQANSAWVSPIGEAFKTVRDNSSINLYYTDNKHQSEYGAYLKACVNYLVIYGTAFTDDVSDCGLDATSAAYLRSVAEQTVLGNESTYLISR